MVPGGEGLPVVRVYDVCLALFQARQAGPVPTALDAKPAGDARPEPLRPGDLSDEVHLCGGGGGGGGGGVHCNFLFFLSSVNTLLRTATLCFFLGRSIVPLMLGTITGGHS